MTDGIADLVLERIEEGFLLLDGEGTVLEANRAARSLLGTDDLVGADVGVLPEEVRDRLSGDPTVDGSAEVVEVHDGDEVSALEVEVAPVDLTGDDDRLVLLRDASERIQRNRYRGILEATGDAVYTLDPDGRYTYTNRANTELLGYDESEMVGTSVSEIVEAEDIERIEEVIGELLDDDDRGRVVVEHDVIDRDGERIPVANHISILLDEDGGFRGTAGVVRDVSERKAREERLERYERIVDAMGDGVYALDEEGRYVAVNDYLIELTGFDREEFLDSPAGSGYDEEDRLKFQRAIRELLAEDDSGVKTVEADLHTADDDAVPIEVNLTVLRGPDGEFRGTVGVVRDVTERKERERELERYETLLDLMPDTVVVTDTEGRHREIHGFEGWTGYSEEELLGGTISMTTPEEDVERANEAVRELFRNDDLEKVTYEQDVITREGERVPMENHLTLLPPDEDGRIPGSMSVLRNISDRKAREEQLRRQNERLEEFASVVSHDLRNPLNVAHARVRMAQGSDDPEILEKADEALDRMAELIDDLLTLAREGQTVGETEPVDLASVAAEAWEGVEAPDASLAVEGDLRVEADRARLVELFGNLFRNALEHAGEGVAVRVGALEGDGRGFYVEDDGPGVPPEDRQTVFERGVTGSADGTGIGLSIVADIAEAHGWSVRATDGSAGGARFEFALDGSDGEGTAR